MASYDLSAESITALLEQVDEICRSSHTDRKEALRLRLAVEEALMDYASAFGTEHRVELVSASFLTKKQIRLHIFCDSLDPFTADDDIGIMRSLMSGMENTPRWRYALGVNVLTFPMAKKKAVSGLVKILLALVLGIVLGFLARGPLADSLGWDGIISDYISPITGAYTGVLCVMAILMIFFTFPLSIVETENLEAFHGVTWRVLRGYITFTVLILLVVCAFCLPGITFRLSGSDGPNVLKSGLDVLLDFIPSNIVAPFLNFNCMQVLLIGLMFGCSFVAMGKKAQPMVEIFDICNLVAVLTNNYLTKLIPLYVGLTAFTTTMQMELKELRSYMSILLIVLACAVILPGVLILFVCLRLKISPRLLCRRLLPAAIINLSSASVGASFITFYNEMAREGGMDINYCTVSSNLGTVLFKPLYTVFLTVLVLRMTAICGMAVTPGWLVLTLLLCVLLSLSIPNVPSGAASVILLLMSQMEFSDSAAQMAVALNVVLQFVIVAADIFCLQCMSFLLAAKEQKLDLEKFRKG